MQRRAMVTCYQQLYSRCSAGSWAVLQPPASNGAVLFGSQGAGLATCVHIALGRAALQSWQGGLHTLSQVLNHSQSALMGLHNNQAALRRSLTTTARQQQQTQQQPAEQKYDSLELTQEKIHAITDKIPQRPVGVVEGASYSVIIAAAFGVLAFILYHFVNTFILEPTALQCFNHTLNYLKADPRVTVRLGSTDDIRAWGSNSTSRVARQQIPHQIYKDANGTEHVRIQFFMRGPSGTGMVNADMFKDATGAWQYTYLLMDVYPPNSTTPSRVYIHKP